MKHAGFTFVPSRRWVVWTARSSVIFLILSLFLVLQTPVALAGTYDFEDGSGFNQINTLPNPPYNAAFDNAWWSWSWDNPQAGRDCTNGGGVLTVPVPPYTVHGCLSLALPNFNNTNSVVGNFTISPHLLTGPATNVSMNISSSGSTTVTAFDASNNILDSKTIPANTGTGTMTNVALAAPGIARVQVSGSPTVGCGIGTKVCLIMDDLVVNNNPLDPATTVTKNDANDPYYGSLVYALNHTAVGQKTITFKLPQGNNTIVVKSSLPVVPAGVTISGGSCTGNSPRIVINGSSAPAGTNGLVLTNGKITLEKITIVGFKGKEIIVPKTTGAGGNLLKCVITRKS